MSFSRYLDYQVLNRLDKESLIQMATLLSLVQPKTTVEWYPVGIVAELKDLTPDGIRKQLKNGDFEEGVDFKKPNGRILINQGAIERIRRKRRSSNG